MTDPSTMWPPLLSPPGIPALGGLEGGADTRACGHVVSRQNAVLRFREARFGRCFTERKESLARRAEDALMREDAVTLKSTLGASEKVVSTTG